MSSGTSGMKWRTIGNQQVFKMKKSKQCAGSFEKQSTKSKLTGLVITEHTDEFCCRCILSQVRNGDDWFIRDGARQEHPDFGCWLVLVLFRLPNRENEVSRYGGAVTDQVRACVLISKQIFRPRSINFSMVPAAGHQKGKSGGWTQKWPSLLSDTYAKAS